MIINVKNMDKIKFKNVGNKLYYMTSEDSAIEIKYLNNNEYQILNVVNIQNNDIIQPILSNKNNYLTILEQFFIDTNADISIKTNKNNLKKFLIELLWFNKSISIEKEMSVKTICGIDFNITNNKILVKNKSNTTLIESISSEPLMCLRGCSLLYGIQKAINSGENL